MMRPVKRVVLPLRDAISCVGQSLLLTTNLKPTSAACKRQMRCACHAGRCGACERAAAAQACRLPMSAPHMAHASLGMAPCTTSYAAPAPQASERLPCNSHRNGCSRSILTTTKHGCCSPRVAYEHMARGPGAVSIWADEPCAGMQPRGPGESCERHAHQEANSDQNDHAQGVSEDATQHQLVVSDVQANGHREDGPHDGRHEHAGNDGWDAVDAETDRCQDRCKNIA